MENSLPSLISPALIVIGWLVIFLNTNRTARRSEIRSLCDKCIDISEKLYKTIQNIEGTDSTLETQVVHTITLLELKGKHLQNKSNTTFIESSTFARIKTLSGNSENTEEIQEILLDLVEEIENKFNDIYVATNIISKYSFFIATFLWIAGVLSLYFLAIKIFMC